MGLGVQARKEEISGFQRILLLAIQRESVDFSLPNLGLAYVIPPTTCTEIQRPI